MTTETTTKTCCDWCGADITYGGESQARNIAVTDYERHFTPGVQTMTAMLVHPMRQKDFCSLVCLAAWASDATSGFPPAPGKGERKGEKL